MASGCRSDSGRRGDAAAGSASDANEIKIVAGAGDLIDLSGWTFSNWGRDNQIIIINLGDSQTELTIVGTPAGDEITGGDSNSLSDFWVRGPEENDQSAAAFREAGVIMAFPTLRGGNGHDSVKEFLLGEGYEVRVAHDAELQLEPAKRADAEKAFGQVWWWVRA